MDENHQDKTESKLIATEDKLWLPPLSLKDQKKLKCLQKKRLSQRLGFAGKTLWDWMDLSIKIIGAVAIPLTVISLILNVNQFNTQQQQAQAQALDQQQQTTLQNYLGTMSDLLLKENLRGPKSDDVVRQVAEAQTLTALQNLNPARKGILVKFLYESHLIGYYDLTNNSQQSPILDLTSADLSGADLSGAHLSGADLDGADLNGAHLSGAYLYYAGLYYAHLYYAHLDGAHLSGADLDGADLSGAHLNGAGLSGADLREADLSGADLSCLNIEQRCTNLLGAQGLTQPQLDQVYSCKGAILPPGLTCHHNQE